MARIDNDMSMSASKAKMAEWWTSVFFSKKCGKSDVMITVNCTGDDSIQQQGCLLNKLLTRIAVTRACENKMAHNIDGKPLHKTTVSWFDFLFDKTGDLLKKHLDNASAG